MYHKNFNRNWNGWNEVQPRGNMNPSQRLRLEVLGFLGDLASYIW